MKAIEFIVTALFTVICISCHKDTGPGVDPLSKPIVILFDNDVHCGKDADGYAQIAGLKSAICAADTAQCLLVSSGDFLQGGVIGSFSKGSDMVTIMNRCGYDAVCLGNHEFDYGMPRLFELTDNLKVPVTCCNMTKVNETEPVYNQFVMVEASSGAKVAFVGILTPEAYTMEHAAFVDKDNKQIYDVRKDYSACVQNAVNQARNSGADYVIALSHLGEKTGEWSSWSMIGATNGIDAVLDGHSHTVVEYAAFPNKDGKMIPLSQTGTKFKSVGKLYISKKTGVVPELIPLEEIIQSSPAVSAVVDSIKQANSKKLDKIVGHTDYRLTIYDQDGVRIVRRKESNIGNFVADAFGYVGGGEITITNGGGIRTDIPVGDIKLRQLIDVAPFGSDIVTAKIKGNAILKILQRGSEGAQDDKECGRFPVVSGMKYVIEKKGTERVKASKVVVWNKDTKSYEPLDLNRTYTVTSTKYFLQGFDYVTGLEIVKEGFGIEYQAVENYLVNGLKGVVSPEYVSVQGRITFE